MTKNLLQVSSSNEIKKELFESTQTHLKTNTTDIDLEASEFVNQLLDFKTQSISEKQSKKVPIEHMGFDAQKKAAKQTELLKKPIKTLSERGEEGGSVANALINLKMQVEELDPGKFDFEAGWFSRTLGRLPGVGTPIKRYFSKFESAQTIIASIIRSLQDGGDQLKRDNITLLEDQKQMYAASEALNKAINLGILIDQKIQHKLDREIPSSDVNHKFISEELLFPLRQRIIDLQQQLVVGQQAILAIEIIIRNNKELIRGVDRALSVTISALETAASVAMALANQKIVLDKIESINKTTSDLISGTASRLKTQGAAIHQQATRSGLNLESLKSSFKDIKSAMEDVATFRTKALPEMANTILELESISREANNSIKKIEESDKLSSQIKLTE